MVQGAGCRVLGARSWVLGAGYQANQYFILYCVIASEAKQSPVYSEDFKDCGPLSVLLCVSSSGFLFVF
jgi:hypothetical protein